MTTEELLEYVRVHLLRDEAGPYLWGDEELLRYFDEAQRNMARATHCIIDSTSQHTRLATVPGSGEYPLHSSIIHVYAALLEDLDRELSPAAFTTWTRGSGAPVEFRASYDNGQATLILLPAADAEYQIRLRVARDPLERMLDGSDPEVPEHAHLALCSWVAHRALRANDPEQLNMQAAETFLMQWRAELRALKRDIYQLNTGPHPRAAVNWTLKGR